MIRVVAKINTKGVSEENVKLIKETVQAMVSTIPVKIGDYYMYGMTPLEFEELEK